MGEKRGEDLRKVGKPSKGSQEGDNGRLREGGRTIHHRACGETRGVALRDNPEEPRGGMASGRETSRETRTCTMGKKGRQGPREADAPSNKGKQEGVQWETQGNKTLRKGARHPTKGNKKGYNGGQAETRPSGRRTHHPTKGNKKRYNGRQEG